MGCGVGRSESSGMVGGGGGHCVMMTGASWQADSWGAAAFQARLTHELAVTWPLQSEHHQWAGIQG